MVDSYDGFISFGKISIDGKLAFQAVFNSWCNLLPTKLL